MQSSADMKFLQGNIFAVEDFLLHVVGGVVIMVAGLKTYPRIAQHDWMEPSCKF